ncbi:MFS general substrate transporter [Coniochaeta ligniaria NRRL 30616]|uniref:MFS general substrate transporter n=1 Tax=Coniochaeta ligniaria NRRL 30616 TaxID=1408157 RepID=A0A1J7JUS4_9PEZI|nr:MFS general substrate transporter [Coniochaeta ligniaria NRRL 30616]
MPFGIIDTRNDAPLAGTEYLIRDDSASSLPDVDGIDTILVPQPSDDDPNDPLLWPTWKREIAFATLFFNNIIFAALPGPMLAPSTFALAGILGVPVTMISELSGYQLLIVGAIGPLVSVLAQKYGKRPQFLFAAVTGTIGTIICIIGSQRYNYNTLLAGRMIQGLGTTAWESLSMSAVGDLLYLHERGLRTAFMVATLTCTPSIVSIISGAMTQACGWQSLFVASLPFNIVGLIGTIFLLPETQFRRSPPRLRSVSEKPVEMAQGAEKPELSVVEMAGPTSQPQKPRQTYLQTLAPMSGTYTDKGILHLLSEIFVHLANPAVIWILLVSGVLIALFVVSAYITSQIWSVPPYNLNIAQNGFFYTGSFLGGLLATVAGPLCDWTARTLTRLNHGIFEAEFRIPIMIIGAVFTALGWFTFMWDVEHPRPNGYLLGAFCHGAACFGISVPSTAAGLYILDSFPKQSTEIFILQMMLKNFLFYAFSTFINSWTAEDGAGFVFRTWGIVSLCLLATSIPMYIFGKVNRRMMSNVHAKYRIFRAVA